MAAKSCPVVIDIWVYAVMSMLLVNPSGVPAGCVRYQLVAVLQCVLMTCLLSISLLVSGSQLSDNRKTHGFQSWDVPAERGMRLHPQARRHERRSSQLGHWHTHAQTDWCTHTHTHTHTHTLLLAFCVLLILAIFFCRFLLLSFEAARRRARNHTQGKDFLVSMAWHSLGISRSSSFRLKWCLKESPDCIRMLVLHSQCSVYKLNNRKFIWKFYKSHSERMGCMMFLPPGPTASGIVCGFSHSCFCSFLARVFISMNSLRRVLALYKETLAV